MTTTTMKRIVFLTSAWLLLIAVSVNGAAMNTTVAPLWPEPSPRDQSLHDDKQDYLTKYGYTTPQTQQNIINKESSKTSNDGIHKAGVCWAVWTQYNNSHVEGGRYCLASSINSCKYACNHDIMCTGIDWDPSSIIKCWIIYAGSIVSRSGVTHFQKQTKCDPCAGNPCQNGGTCVPTGDLTYTCKCPTNYYGLSCENCFPGDSLVLASNGLHIRMSELAVGDRVLTVDVATGHTQFNDVVAFLHRDVNATSLYVQVQTESGYKVSLTPGHLIYVSDTTASTDANMMFADRVRVGQYVFNVGNLTWTDGRTSEVIAADKVTWVSTVVRQAGGYAPLTSTGTIVVDGILASCYASFDSHQLADLAMTPLKISYHIQEFLGLHWFDSALVCGRSLHCYAASLQTMASYVFSDSWWF